MDAQFVPPAPVAVAGRAGSGDLQREFIEVTSKGRLWVKVGLRCRCVAAAC